MNQMFMAHRVAGLWMHRRARFDNIKTVINKDHKVDVEKACQAVIREYEATGKFDLKGKAVEFRSKFYPESHPGYVAAVMSLMSEWIRKEYKGKPKGASIIAALFASNVQ